MIPPLAVRIYRSCMRLLPIKSGLTTLAFNAILNRWFRRCDATVRSTYFDGTPVDVSIHDYHGRILYLFGTNDPKVSDVSHALLRPGDVFLDIGANYGSIGWMAARAVGDEGMVHLFEPQKLLCDRVQSALDSAARCNIRLHRVGLLDQDGTFVLSSPQHHSGMATFAQRQDTDAWTKKEVCEVKDITTYVPPLIEQRRFSVKLDVEGAEPRIMPWLLAQPNLHFMVFEAAHHHERLYADAVGAGMTIYGLSRHPVFFQLSRVDRFDEMRAFHDLVAVRLPSGTTARKTLRPVALGRQLAGSRVS
jgi:FkbM family methyltransferase